MNSVSLGFRLFRAGPSRAELGESPVWDPAANTVWWVDIDGSKLMRVELDTGNVETWNTPEIPGFVVLTSSGRPALGMQTGIFLFDPGNTQFERIVPFEHPGHRFNDATVDPLGRLWVSTMSLDARPGTASILAVTEKLQLKPLINGLTIPNGLAVDLERGRLFYSDSHPDIQTIWMRSAQPGSFTLGKASLFSTTFVLKGRPDGAALDERGYYWIAGVDGAALYVFDRHGRLHTEIALSYPAPTKLCFIGPRAIAVTSKSIGEDGGFLALADLPETFAPGITQPCWAFAAG